MVQDDFQSSVLISVHLHTTTMTYRAAARQAARSPRIASLRQFCSTQRTATTSLRRLCADTGRQYRAAGQRRSRWFCAARRRTRRPAQFGGACSRWGHRASRRGFSRSRAGIVPPGRLCTFYLLLCQQIHRAGRCLPALQGSLGASLSGAALSSLQAPQKLRILLLRGSADRRVVSSHGPHAGARGRLARRHGHLVACTRQLTLQFTVLRLHVRQTLFEPPRLSFHLLGNTLQVLVSP